MSEAPPGFGVPAAFPDALHGSDELKVLAARRAPSRGPVYWAFLFSEHDTAGLVAALAPNDPSMDLSGWSELYERWRAHAPTTRPRYLLGEAMVFQALTDEDVVADADRAGRLVRDALPLGRIEDDACSTEQGFLIWEANRPASADETRVLCVLAQLTREQALDEWVWTRGPLGLAPFGRYLLHASKLRYELGVYHRMQQLRLLRGEVERSLGRLSALHSHIDQGQAPVEDLVRGQRKLETMEAGARGLLVAITQLQELQQTVVVARANIASQVPQARAQGSGRTFFERDLALADWLTSQIDSDLVYLRALRQRAQEVRNATASLVEGILQQRRDRLGVLQSSFLGALLMGLAAMQALEFRVPLPLPLQAPLVAMLMSLALTLPVAALRWSGMLRRHEPHRWFDRVAFAVLVGTALWLAASITAVAASPTAAAWLALGGVTVGVAAAITGLLRVARNRRSFMVENARS